MSLMINRNLSALNAWRNLTLSDSNLSRSMERLSSGVRINRAADDPAGLAISEKLRAQVNGFDAAVKNSETAINLVQTAEAGLSKVSTLLIKLRGLAVDSANAGTADRQTLAANQDEVTQILESIDRIAKNTRYGTKKLLDGTNDLKFTVAGVGAANVGGMVSGNAPEGTYQLALSQAISISADAGSVLAEMGLAFVNNDPLPVTRSLTPGVHTLAYSGALESAETNAAGLHGAATAVLSANTGLRLTDPAAAAGSLGAGEHTVRWAGTTTGGLLAVTPGWGSAPGTGVCTSTGAAYTGTYTGNALVVRVNAAANFGANIAADGTLTVKPGGGTPVSAAWDAVNKVLSWAGGSLLFHANEGFSGLSNAGDSFTCGVAASDTTLTVDGVATKVYSNDLEAGRVTAGGVSFELKDLSGASPTAGTDLLVASKGTEDVALAPVDRTNTYYSGVSSAAYTFSFDRSFSVAGGKVSTLDGNALNVVMSNARGDPIAALTLANGGSVANLAFAGTDPRVKDLNFNAAAVGGTLSLGAGGYLAARTFAVTLTASSAALVLDGNLDGAGRFSTQSTTVTATSANFDSIQLDVSGVSIAHLGAGGSLEIFDFMAALSGVTGTTGAQTAVRSGQKRVELADGAGNWLTLNLGSTLTGGQTADIRVEESPLTFQIGANETQAVKLTIKDLSSESLAVKAHADPASDLALVTSNFGSLADLDVTTTQGAQDAIVMIDAAVDQVSAVRGYLGAFQADNLEVNLDNLRVSRANLQASESVIRDTDMASETALFTKYQIMRQAGTAMLAQANQAPVNLLVLLAR